MSRSLKVFFELEHKEKIRENIWWAQRTQPVLKRVKRKTDIKKFPLAARMLCLYLWMRNTTLIASVAGGA